MTLATYIPGQGVLITIHGQGEGVSVLLSERMTLGAVERYVRELEAFYG